MNQMTFNNRMEFREWLMENANSEQGIWLVFSKQKSSDKIKASEALEEALCFGWIDGQIKGIDKDTYIKYFKQRGNNSSWSEKNKKLVEVLEQKNLMSDFGRKKVEYAKQNGYWEPVERNILTDEQRQDFEDKLRSFDQAYANFKKMSQSVCNTYMASYFFGAKTEEGKKKRFQSIIERLNLNLNPMESMKDKSKESADIIREG